MSVVQLVLPDFLLIAMGWLLFHKLKFSASFFQGTEKLVYFILFPALLFHSITQTPLTLSSTYLVFVAVAALMGFGVLASWLAVPVIHPNSLDHASVAQCGYRFNTYIGLSLAAGLAGASGQTAMAVIVGFAVPISNIAAVHGLARQQKGLKILPELIKNPFIIATVLALACNLLRIPIPHVIDVTLGRLGACAIALGLMCVGATLSLRGGRGSAPLMSWILAVRLLVMPAAALFIGWALDLQPADRQALLLFGALPASSAAYVLAARMGGNGPLVAVTMSLTTLFSIITIPFWLTIAPMT
ncbi:AEC family transporter [Pusillimonas sp. ANT_WB101]|uniref:AEC family transporter n=1 Tax=Pusillimonas sp. ANT_WB101 TaxID=2597356 RepID=UPI0011F06C1F|nr:AEC family transporter [Pusillimonas sp. ANT_WB101]KAA0890197.1 AEC family transporter [Pusillimonas sp. ANT_WB101]